MTSPYPPSNFGFLAEHDALFVELTASAERAFASDPNTTLIKLRQLGESTRPAYGGDVRSRF